jgi:hypothetical protein
LCSNFKDIPEEFIIDVGIAIEKAGRRIDTLKYYKEALNYFEGNAEKQKLVATRWIVTKELQAKLKNTSGKLERERINEANDMRNRYNIRNPNLPVMVENNNWSALFEYIIKNELGNKADDTNKQQRKLKVVTKPVKNQEEINAEEGMTNGVENNQKQLISFIFEEYKFDYYQKQKRLNITNIAEGKTVIVNNGEARSLDYGIIKNEDELGLISFKINGTPINIYISNDFTDKGVTVRFDEIKMDFNFFEMV